MQIWFNDGVNGFAQLSPVQSLTPTPYAVNVTGPVKGGLLTAGSVPDTAFSSNVALRSGGNTFTGNQIVSGGNVGIGTTNPATLLALNSPTVNGATLSLTSGSYTSAIGQKSYNAPDHSLQFLNVNATSTDQAFSFLNGSIASLLMILANGNVGIGTTAPSQLLDVEGNVSAGGPSSANHFLITGNQIQQYSGGSVAPMYLNYGGGNVILGGSSGNVGIGSGAPTDKLYVIGNARVDGQLRMNVNTGGTTGTRTALIQAMAGDGVPFGVTDQNGIVLLEVTTNSAAGGTVLIVFGDATKSQGGSTWAAYSDERLKQNIRLYDHGLGAILKLRTVRFEYRDDPKRHTTSGHEEIGLIAQQVEGVIPEAVSKDAEGYRTLNASPIYWAAINAIQELNGKVEDRSQESGVRIQKLEKENAELKQQSAELETRLSALEKMLKRQDVAKGGE